ncbi:MAG: arylsulfatase A-like enzyme [Planctomycetota bacterium]|jgi:arylsulfatase A-like enzyme
MLVSCLLLLVGVSVAAPPAGAQARVENVLFIISDDLRANALGCYGNKVCRTPNIDALAQRGMVFDRAYCQGTVCGPSRQSLMFSRYRGKGDINLGQHFRENGFYSARAGKIYHMLVPGDIIRGSDGKDVASSWTERFNSQGMEAHTPGDYACLNLDIFTKELAGRQSTRMPHRWSVSVRYEGDGSDQPDHKTATKIIELLRAKKSERFFLAAGFVRPHYPMVAPEQFFTPYRWQDLALPAQVDGDLDDIPKLGQASNRTTKNGLAEQPDNQRRMWAAYYAAVTFMDAQVGRIVDELDRLGLRETTAIVFTSDHGYHLGDHTFWLKNNLHEQVTHVPLIVSAPGVKPGRTDSIAELVDLFPTMSELAGLEQPAGLHGQSLVPVLDDPNTSIKDGALSFARGTSWRTRDWAYMRYKDGSEELYDMRDDAGQFTNLAGTSGHRATKERLAAAMDARLANPAARPAHRPRNVILIMADDSAADNYGCYGSTFFKTPRLDALAKTGARFRHCYSSAVCTPSRVKIMTGRSGIRNYTAFGRLDRDEITFGTMMQQAGHATAIAGKWQLHGSGNGSLAPGCGFDSYCLWNYPGTKRARFWQPSLMRNGKLLETTTEDYGPDLFTDYLIEFIKKNKDRPFFAYYPMVLVHAPFVRTPDSEPAELGSNAKLHNYRAMMTYADKCVGRIVDALDEHGLREDTVLIFTADNGTGRGLTYPYRNEQRKGEKAFATDGGTHAPLIVNCPGTVPPGTVSDDLVDFSDMMPTIAAITGAKLPDVELDGQSFWPQCRNEKGDPRQWIFQYYFPKFAPAAKAHGQGVRNREIAWVQNQHYKLYRDGTLYSVSDRHETEPIAPKTNDIADAARSRLQGALDSMPKRAAKLQAK